MSRFWNRLQNNSGLCRCYWINKYIGCNNQYCLFCKWSLMIFIERTKRSQRVGHWEQFYMEFFIYALYHSICSSYINSFELLSTSSILAISKLFGNFLQWQQSLCTLILQGNRNIMMIMFTLLGTVKIMSWLDSLVCTEGSQLPPLHSFKGFLLTSVAKDKTPCKLKYVSIFIQAHLFSALFLGMLNNGNESSNHCK